MAPSQKDGAIVLTGVRPIICLHPTGERSYPATDAQLGPRGHPSDKPLAGAFFGAGDGEGLC